MMFTKIVFMIVAIPFCYFGLVNARKTSKRLFFKFKETSLSFGRSTVRLSIKCIHNPLEHLNSSIKEKVMSNGLKGKGWACLIKDILKYRSDDKFLLNRLLNFVLASKHIFHTPAATGREIICLHSQLC